MVLAGTEGHARTGRLVTALRTARESATGDEGEPIVVGAGTQWVPELEDEDGHCDDPYRAVKAGPCIPDCCSWAVGVDDAVTESGLVRLDDHHGHPSVRWLVEDGYEVITFRGAAEDATPANVRGDSRHGASNVSDSESNRFPGIPTESPRLSESMTR